MPKLSDLNGALAKALDMTENAITQFTRRAREAGLISQAGRGPGGAEMTIIDAVNSIIAVVGGEYAKDSADTIRGCRQLVLHDRYRARGKVAVRATPNLESVPLSEIEHLHYLAEVLELLFHRAIDGSLAAYADAYEASSGNDAPALTIQFNWPPRNVRLEYWKPGSDGAPGFRNNLRFFPPSSSTGATANLTQSKTINHRAILEIANLFRKEPP